ncbi:MAG: bifunctional DNA-formamidopyrimidine glycosylase/DNA-(apurinic or apyrimidinic site) lyase [Alphaproteobacteria bacterium]|nr:MAG: bifunctional DNA-formamidopyrimidine glycosylase/DNA-(apurinic or apyrimidinic site) lyase [Alphaproteobacteria bacterium]
MPELPEVETVRRGLEPVLVGRRIRRAEPRSPGLRRPFPRDLAARLTGARVRALGRRGKYLLADLGARGTLVIHLGMSGRVLVDAQPLAEAAHHHRRDPGPHDHLLLTLEDGAQVVLNDARRFGLVLLLPPGDALAMPPLAALGPEPLGNRFDADWLLGRAASRRTAIKALLLDQGVVAGLGNIYVCEALWAAGIDPRRPAGELSAAEAERLVRMIRDVLERAIAAGGSSLRDHRQVNGELGYFQHRFAVYDREGAPCQRPGCAGEIIRIRQGGRSSFLCPRCQR